MPPRMYVTCPSYAINNPVERAERLGKATQWAELCGWEVIASPLLSRYQAGGTWVPLELRANDMVAALLYDVLWAAKGGYGAVELIPTLVSAEATQAPLLIGYSDITVLHACWAKRSWGPTIYGSLADSVENSRRGESLRALLQGHGYRCSHETEAAVRVLRSGTVRAPIFAACLVVLANMAGTPAMPSLAGRILAIEDIDERAYAVDFALHQLYLSGALDGVVGLIGGSFHHTPHADYGGPSVDEILTQWAERLQVPALARMPFGHMDDPMVLVCGVPATLEARAGGDWSLAWEKGELLSVR